ncbi:DISARM system phospholipase D-like protein DrmC [Methylomonas paludis]|uniref:DISARM system phospholipase D-like protein DrmC n=2 Tax=Methylomonas paludis TaxID=1173101 RepID=A0A975MKV9_9GAMM|nr:DISARM system phospholipase D-like protein DrmC [Methylomonas paludis]
MKAACETLRTLPATISTEFVLKSLPPTNNSDLSFLIAQTVNAAAKLMTCEALSWTLQSSFTTYHRCIAHQHIELLWSGPKPDSQITARRIDQVLYDLIANAKQEILLITFAAAKIERLVNELINAKKRGVNIRLILEFEQSSEGQLSYDALKAFPSSLVAGIQVYYWPLENRERNHAGRPGKLHAKIAVVDDEVLVTSANLTDDAFNRNLEVGVLIHEATFQAKIKSYFDHLVTAKVICKLKN